MTNRLSNRIDSQRHNDLPRVYVACLGAYNAGQLVGQWVDADCFLPDMVKELTAKWYKEGGDEWGDEWAIHDHEFGSAWPGGEYPDLEEVGELGEAIEDLGEPFKAFLSYADTKGVDISDLKDQFASAYHGDDTPSNTAQVYAEEVGYVDFSNTNPLAYCIDWEHAYKLLGFYNVDGYNFIRND